ncbi:DMT family transporter [Acidimangrovimonas pyrenivorans]|uniref:DMT family transporter n=1 Tax=Acidimangrovimonas pyrenivorans TaxID=2030798 RepID=A0ABV7AK79_9RHOB
MNAPGPAAATRGILLMLLAVFTFTLMDATAKSLVGRYPTLQVVWARYTGQSVIVALVLARRLGPLLRTRHPWLQGLRSVLQLGATALFFTALGHIGLAEATAIMDANPVIITLGAALVLSEPIGPRRLAGVLAAMIGALIIIRPGSAVFASAALLPLAAAVCYAGYVLVTRLVGRDENTWTSLIYTAALGTVLTTIALPTVWQPIAAPDILPFMAMGAIGAAAQFFLIRAFTIAEAGLIAPFGYVGLLFATFWGIVLFGEYPDLWTGIGGAVIVCAGLYVWHRETRAARQG